MTYRHIARYFAALFITATLIQPLQAAAITDPLFYVRNDILMYDDECVDVGVGAVQLAGNDNTEIILNFLMREVGLNLAQAAGIIGNMIQESQLKPNIEEGMKLVGDDYIPKNGTGFGLVQWTFTARQGPLKDHIDAMGLPITSMAGQLSFVKKELEGDYLSTLNKLRATNDPVEAAIIVEGGYEISADSDAKVREVRGGAAQQVYDKYKDAEALAGSSADGSMNNPGGFDTNAPKNDTSKRDCSQTGFSGGNFAETVKAYAWPDYRGNTLEMQPAYVEAVAKARAEPGMYVGDGLGDWGVDCGVFVTLLIRDSGFDKGYNYEGKGGNTVQQYKWTAENWESLGDASSIDPATLQPGDVANNESTHTFVYIGEVEGFESKIASASWGERAPMADTGQSPTQSGYTWFRKKN